MPPPPVAPVLPKCHPLPVLLCPRRASEVPPLPGVLSPWCHQLPESPVLPKCHHLLVLLSPHGATMSPKCHHSTVLLCPHGATTPHHHCAPKATLPCGAALSPECYQPPVPPPPPPCATIPTHPSGTGVSPEWGTRPCVCPRICPQIIKMVASARGRPGSLRSVGWKVWGHQKGHRCHQKGQQRDFGAGGPQALEGTHWGWGHRRVRVPQQGHGDPHGTA